MEALQEFAGVTDTSARKEWVLDHLKKLAALSFQYPSELLSGDSKALLESITLCLNDEDVSLKTKVTLLSVLANCSRISSNRASIKISFLGLSENGSIFEQHLLDKEQGAQEFGTALGSFHLLTLVILLRCTKYELTAKDLLELVNSNVDIALLLILSIIKVASYENELILASFRLISELSHPRTYLSDEGTYEFSAMAIACENVGHLVKRQNVLGIVCEVLNTRLNKEKRAAQNISVNSPNNLYSFHRCIACFASLVLNLHALSTANILDHLAVATKSVQDVFLPYLLFISEEIASIDASISSDLFPVLKSCKLCLQVITEVAFRPSAQASAVIHAILLNNITPEYLSACFIEGKYNTEESLGLFSLLVSLNINIDSAVECAITDKLSTERKPEGLVHLIVESFSKLTEANQNKLLDDLTGGDVDRMSNTQVLKEVRFAMQVAFDQATYEVLLSALERARKGDTASLAQDIEELQVTKGDTGDSDEKEKTGEAEKVPESVKQYGSYTSKKTGVSQLSSLNNLPDISSKPMSKSSMQLPRRKKKKKKSEQESNSSVPSEDVPPELLCSINGHIMKEPMRSKYGHAYERQTILKWIKTNGQICPLTGAFMAEEDVVVDKELKEKIVHWHVARSIKQSKNVNKGFDNESIYSF